MSKKLTIRRTAGAVLITAGIVAVIAAAAQLAKTGALGPTVIVVLLTAFYWAPSIVAATRHARNWGSVLVVNLFTGWTVIGWVVALAMALRTSTTR